MKVLIQALSQPDAYPHPVDQVEVRRTHISVVFLAGGFAYKFKKPVDLGFVDYSTRKKRRHFCRREVKLNARLAPDVYLDVVSVVDRDGGLRVQLDDVDSAVEWAVRMRRLDEGDTLASRLGDGRIEREWFARLGRRIARFHAEARGGAEIDACARFEVVEKNALDNFRQSQQQVGHIVDEHLFERLRELFRRRLDQLQPLIEDRARRGVARDTHGDLRLEHVYFGDDGELRIVDCIEFNDAFRHADPICDIAFLAMDLGFRGYDEEAQKLLTAYFDERDDDDGRRLVDFYVAYRSCVRAKVRGFQALDEGFSDSARADLAEQARAHWLYALVRLEDEERQPRLILIGGLPATGKSTLARQMQRRGEVDVVLDSDLVRKDLAGLAPTESAQADFGDGIYSAEFSKRTYAELGRRARRALKRGDRVAVAATFVSDRRRRELLQVARSLSVPARFIECVVSDDEARRRLRERVDDPSDADVTIYEELKERWDSPSDEIAQIWERRHN